MSAVFIVPNHTGPAEAVEIDERICIGCNACAHICRMQTILPNPIKGAPPVVAYPDECWYCGCCVEACPTGALQMRLPINQRILFKRRDTGEVFRLGSAEAPDKTFFRAPYGQMPDSESLAKARALLDGKVPVSAVVLPGTAKRVAKLLFLPDTDAEGRFYAMLRRVGFAEICESPSVAPAPCVVIGGNVEGAALCLTAKDAADLLVQLCVSRFTARQVWQQPNQEV